MKKFILLMLALVILVSFAACGGNTDDPSGDPDNKPTADVSGKTDDKKDDDDDFKIDIKDDANTVTWKIGTITFVFKHDGTNVTAYSEYMDMETVDSAKDLMNVYEYTKAAENEDIKSITRKGSVIIIEYKESAFHYTTYEELKTMAEVYKSVMENQ